MIGTLFPFEDGDRENGGEKTERKRDDTRRRELAIYNVNVQRLSVTGSQTNNTTLSAVLACGDQHNNFVPIIVPLQGGTRARLDSIHTEKETRRKIKISLSIEEARRE